MRPGKIEANAEFHRAGKQASGRNLGDRQALEYMREVLQQLVKSAVGPRHDGYLTRGPGQRQRGRLAALATA